MDHLQLILNNDKNIYKNVEKNIDKNINIINNDIYTEFTIFGSNIIFDQLLKSLGSNIAIIWALNKFGINIFRYITNPSQYVIDMAISIDISLFNNYNITDNNRILKIISLQNNNVVSLIKLIKSDVIIYDAVKINPFIIKDIDNLSVELCELSLDFTTNENIMVHIPFRTPKINNHILYNVNNNNWSLKYLSKKFYNTVLLNSVLSRDYDDNLQYIEHITTDIVNMSLSGYKSQNFKYVPDIFKTIDVCRIYVALNIYNLLYVPNYYIYKEIIDDNRIINWDLCKYKNISTGISKIIIYQVTHENFGKLNIEICRLLLSDENFISNCTEIESNDITDFYKETLYGPDYKSNDNILYTIYFKILGM